MKNENENVGSENIEQAYNQKAPVFHIKCATPLLSVVKGIYNACQLPLIGAEHLEGIPVLPSWAENICKKLRKTIFKSFLELQQGGEEIDWRNFGRLIGIWQRQSALLKQDSSQPEMTPSSALISSLQQITGDVLLNVQTESPTEQKQFFSGMAEGYELFMDANGHFTGDKGRTGIYLALLGNWTQIEQIRRSLPAKSRHDLYDFVAPLIGDSCKERFEWFCDVCDEIGLHVHTRGRPRKSLRK